MISGRYRKGFTVFKSPMLTFSAVEIYYRYNNVKFISIRRRKDKVIDSWVRKDFQKKHAASMSEADYREITSSYIDEVDNFLKSPFFSTLKEKGDYLELNFEELLANEEETLKRVRSFMGLAEPLNVPKDIVIDKAR